MRHCFIIIQTCDRMQSFTILQDELHPFNKHIQDDRSTPFLCTTNYRIGHNIKREDNSIPGLFSQNTMLLCGMQVGMDESSGLFCIICILTYLYFSHC